MAAHLVDEFNGNGTTVHGSEKQRHACGLFGDLCQRCGPRQDEDTVGLLGIAAPDLATIDHPLVTVPHRSGLQLGSITADVRLGDRESQFHLASGDFGEIAPFHLLTTMLNNRHGRKHGKVNWRGTGRASTGGTYLPQHYAGFRDPKTTPAIGRRNDRTQPAGSSKGVKKVMGINASAV